MRGRRLMLSLATVLVAVAASGALAAPATAAPLDYVALGDSAAAGPLIPNQDINLACLRSDRNYPAVAARLLGARLTDVSCSAATISHFTSRQYGFIPAQFNALSPATDLVTVTIGGNDVNLVAHALTCINLLPSPAGISCAARLTAGGKDVIGQAITAWAPKFGQSLDEIQRRAAAATIVVAGYATYVRPGGCYPIQPIWAQDANYLQAKVNQLSAALRDQALARGATFVDLAAVSVGHDTCAAPANRYMEGLVPTTSAAPLHPNAAGMAAFGTAIAAAVR